MRLLAWLRVYRSRLLSLWAVGLASSLLVMALSSLGILDGAQARALDLLSRSRSRQLPHDVVIVAIDDSAFKGLGGRQPLSREYLARIVRGVQRSGAIVVGFNVTFTPTTESEDRALAQAILDFADDGVSRVVVAGPLVPGSGPLGDPAVLKAVVQGSPRLPMDSDGIIRRVEPLIPGRSGEAAKPALSLAVAARLGGMDPSRLAAALTAHAPLPIPLSRPGRPFERPGASPILVAPGDQWKINYVGGAATFLTINSDPVAQLSEPGAKVYEDNPLRGRIVLIGSTFAESRDAYPTPLGMMPGVEIQANIIHMLTSRHFIQPLNWAWSLAINAGVVLVAGAIFLVLRPLLATLACVMGELLVGVPASYYAFDRGGYLVDFLLPMLTTCVMGIGIGALARRRVRPARS